MGLEVGDAGAGVPEWGRVPRRASRRATGRLGRGCQARRACRRHTERGRVSVGRDGLRNAKPNRRVTRVAGRHRDRHRRAAPGPGRHVVDPHAGSKGHERMLGSGWPGDFIDLVWAPDGSEICLDTRQGDDALRAIRLGRPRSDRHARRDAHPAVSIYQATDARWPRARTGAAASSRARPTPRANTTCHGSMRRKWTTSRSTARRS